MNTAQQEIDILKPQAEKYRKQKRGLMQKLLPGDWRIKPEIIKKNKGFNSGYFTNNITK